MRAVTRSELGIGRVVVPLTASGAWRHRSDQLRRGLRVRQVGSRGRARRPQTSKRELCGAFRAAARPICARRALGTRCAVQRSVDMRYRYQVHELELPLPEGQVRITEKDLTASTGCFDDPTKRRLVKGPATRGRQGNTHLSAYGDGFAQKTGHSTAQPVKRSDGSDALKSRRDVYFEEERKVRLRRECTTSRKCHRGHVHRACDH